MPPRIPPLRCMKGQLRNSVAPNASCRGTKSNTAASSTTSCHFTTSTPCQASTVAQKRKYRDPYVVAQARARKAANLSRQEMLKKERVAALGDPVRGITTEFVQSFDTALPPGPAAQTVSTPPHMQSSSSSSNAYEHSPGPKAEEDEHLNFYLNKHELQHGLEQAQWLSTPPPEQLKLDTQTTDVTPAHRLDTLQQGQQTAAEALRRIASLSLASSKDRMRVNIQRCISAFGRHHTDQTLPPKPLSEPARAGLRPQVERMERVGPDTGSSEVQIAILTAKIRTLAEFLQTRGRMDKVNKRNLRLLVHRRQKLLQYLRRKERGGPRWQHLVETLGLTEGTWKGEISL